MENHVLVWRIIGVIAVLCIVASFSMVYSIVQELNAMKAPDTSVIEELIQALRKTDSSFASE